MRGEGWGRGRRFALAAAIGLCGVAPAQGQPVGDPSGAAPPTPPPAQAQPGPSVDVPKYPVSRVVIIYAREHADHPAPEEILQAEVTLGIDDAGFVKAREDLPAVTMRIADFDDEPMRRYSLLALTSVVQAVFEEYRRRGLIGVIVDASGDIYLPMRRNPETGEYELNTDDPNAGRDLRAQRLGGAATELHLVVHTATVTQVRTQASGNRIRDEERLNNRRHAFIRENSPVQPAEGGAGDLLRKDRVDEFMYRLNRHPGRRVDAAISAGTNPGELTLDYLVNESKPWALYFQVSNTGTDETDEWRQRFGFTHNQLTGHDDILTVDYITAAFDETNAVLASYEARVGSAERLRWRVYGNWNEFTASDVGFSGEQFEGDGWTGGGELIWNFFQKRELFLDAVAGLRWQNVAVDNIGLGTSGESDFLLPSLGVRLERQTDLSTTLGSVTLEGNLADAAGTDEAELPDLGRLSVDAEWIALRFDFYHSVFLEPLLNRRRWEDISTKPTLAHELAAYVRGQYAFDYRLVPNFEQVVGGLYTVRGYPESTAAGDTVVVGTLEYRLHLPWALRQEAEPRQFFGRQFRMFPQQPYGRADWDFVIRGFLDAGWAINSERLSTEDNEFLLGTGLGLELVYRRNVSVRLDWGIALHDTEAGQVVSGQFSPDWTSGRSRVHVSATLLY